MRLKMFLENESGYGYISAKYDLERNKALDEVLKSLDIKNTISPEKLHVSIMYDTSNSKTNKGQDLTRIYEGNIIDVKKLGEPGSKWEAIVLELKSASIEKRHKELKDLGFKHSYKDFIAHMSIKYQPEKEDLQKLKNNIDKFPTKLYFRERKWERTKD